jgi:hypothetical protein
MRAGAQMLLNAVLEFDRRLGSTPRPLAGEGGRAAAG